MAAPATNDLTTLDGALADTTSTLELERQKLKAAKENIRQSGSIHPNSVHSVAASVAITELGTVLITLGEYKRRYVELVNAYNIIVGVLPGRRVTPRAIEARLALDIHIHEMNTYALHVMQENALLRSYV